MCTAMLAVPGRLLGTTTYDQGVPASRLSRLAWRRTPESEVVRITSAGANHREDIAARQRRYVVSMGVRTLCFIGAVVIGDGWLRWVLVAGAVFLPYFAVVMANASNDGGDGFSPEAPSLSELTSSGDNG